jgi:hypothetical protein
MSDDRFRIHRDLFLRLLSMLVGGWATPDVEYPSRRAYLLSRKPLSSHCSIKIPANFSGTFEGVEIPHYSSVVQPDAVIPGGPYTVKVVKSEPVNRRKSSSHRVFLVCPICQRDLPTGRFHQHRGACKDDRPEVVARMTWEAEERVHQQNQRDANVAHHTGYYEGM